jgi:hypothetical protein
MATQPKPLQLLAEGLKLKPSTLRFRLAYYHVKVKGKTLKQLAREASKIGIEVPPELLGGGGNGHAKPGRKSKTKSNDRHALAARSGRVSSSEAGLARRLHGLKEQLRGCEMLARQRIGVGNYGDLEVSILKAFQFATTGATLDIKVPTLNPT